MSGGRERCLNNGAEAMGRSTPGIFKATCDEQNFKTFARKCKKIHYNFIKAET